ncbi:MAG: GntR family transcriptional regulator [Chloroflexia bacterium]|nr:GntR family transcriptional regulator [Chloroflexia bacterium]
MSVFGAPLAPSPSKADQVYEQVCAAIFAGRLKPGDRVNVDAITRDLGVSKIPVREAMQRLEAGGLIVQTPHAGARVAPVSLREWEGIFLVRAELEGLAARLAAAAMTETDLRELRTVHAEAEAEHATGKLERMSEHNRRFHRTITRASGYQTLETLVEQVLVTVARFRAVIELNPAIWRQSLDEHQDIIAALATGDPNLAERVARTHVRQQLASTLARSYAGLDQAASPAVTHPQEVG